MRVLGEALKMTAGMLWFVTGMSGLLFFMFGGWIIFTSIRPIWLAILTGTGSLFLLFVWIAITREFMEPK